MIQVLTGTKDEVANEFMEITPSNTVQYAIRRFAQNVQESKFVNNNAKDFNLYLLGTWDTQTGTVLGREKPEIIAKATEFSSDKKEEEKQKNG